MRTPSWIAIAALLLGCGGAEPPRIADERATPQPAPVAPTPALAEADTSDLPPPRPSPQILVPAEAATDDGSEPVETTEPSTEPPALAEPQNEDPLAPILPTDPEPGSPEADAELAALLDESTITQDEFDEAFRGGGPNVRDDQLKFGGQRRVPVIGVGTPKISAGKLSAAELKALVQADERKLIGCHAMALTNDPKATGSVTLRLRFDGQGAVAAVEHEGGSALGSELLACLASVANTWRPANAADAKVDVPLTLSVE